MRIPHRSLSKGRTCSSNHSFSEALILEASNQWSNKGLEKLSSWASLTVYQLNLMPDSQQNIVSPHTDVTQRCTTCLRVCVMWFESGNTHSAFIFNVQLPLIIDVCLFFFFVNEPIHPLCISHFSTVSDGIPFRWRLMETVFVRRGDFAMVVLSGEGVTCDRKKKEVWTLLVNLVTDRSLPWLSLNGILVTVQQV